MSKNKIELPTYKEAKERYDDFNATLLDEFIYRFEPITEKDSRRFRKCLENALQYVIENVGAFGLTLDAPVKPIRNTTCPQCGMHTLWTDCMNADCDYGEPYSS